MRKGPELHIPLVIGSVLCLMACLVAWVMGYWVVALFAHTTSVGLLMLAIRQDRIRLARESLALTQQRLMALCGILVPLAGPLFSILVIGYFRRLRYERASRLLLEYIELMGAESKYYKSVSQAWINEQIRSNNQHTLWLEVSTQPAMDLNPAAPRQTRKKALFRLRQARHPDEILRLKRARSDMDPDISSLAATILMKIEEDLQDDIAKGEEAIRKSPMDPTLRHAVASLYINVYRSGIFNDNFSLPYLKKALSHCNHGLSIDPSMGELFYCLGKIKTSLEDLDGAVEAFHRALELMPQDPRVLGWLAECQYLRGDWDGLRQACARTAEIPGLHNKLVAPTQYWRSSKP